MLFTRSTLTSAIILSKNDQENVVMRFLYGNVA